MRDVNIDQLISFHCSKKVEATLTATYPPGRFGALDIKDGIVETFKEKPKAEGGMINGGFFVLSSAVIDLISGDDCIWEKDPLEKLADNHQLAAFPHDGFWQPMIH